MITAACAVEVRGALVRCDLECLVENFEDVPPPGGGSSARHVLPDTDSVQNARRTRAAQTARVFAYIPVVKTLGTEQMT